MNIVFIDAESQSLLDINVGSYKYCQHPSTRPLMWSVLPYTANRSLVFEEPNPFDVLRRLRDTNRLKWGKKKKPLIVMHWSPFDRLLAQAQEPLGWSDDPHVYGVRGPHNTIWVDLSELALTAGLPMKLAHAAVFVDQELKGDGTRLINLFSKPDEEGRFANPADYPVQWEEFRQYAAQDTMPMRPIYDALVAAGVNPGEHAERSWAVRRMNDRGVGIDVASAQYVMDKLAAAQDKAEQEVFDLYGFKTSQVAKAREFLGLPNMQVDTVTAAIEAGQLDPDQLFVAEARVGLAGAARKKLASFVRFADEQDQRARGGFIYHGAWTGRLTSMGIQLQNFVRSKSREEFFASIRTLPLADLFTETRANIRGFLRADEGHTLIGADFKAIELCVGGWLADEAWLVEALHAKRDVYRKQAAVQFLCPESEITDEERQYGKNVVLAGMYQQGGKGFQKRREKEGELLPLDQCNLSIARFRDSHPAFVKAWEEASDQFKRCIRSPAGARVEVFGGKILFERFANNITIIRPSGGTQIFWMPEIVEGEWPNGNPREEIAFVCKSDTTGMMMTDRTYGGNIFQNCVQGIAFDLIIEAMIRLERGGYETVMSIHDEAVVELPEELAMMQLPAIVGLMKQSDEWADGIPIEVETWVSRRFTK